MFEGALQTDRQSQRQKIVDSYARRGVNKQNQPQTDSAENNATLTTLRCVCGKHTYKHNVT